MKSLMTNIVVEIVHWAEGGGGPAIAGCGLAREAGDFHLSKSL
jgi:hypothetical protein